MNEIARFQRLSSVRSAGSDFHEPEERPSASTARPVRPSSPRSREARHDAFEEPRRVDAVVVGEGDQIRVDVRKARVARTRQTTPGACVHELEAPSVSDLRDPLVLVLVDDDDAQRPVALLLDRVEEAAELVRSTHRRDDEVERRKLPRHGP